jgi:hypothetical protein
MLDRILSYVPLYLSTRATCTNQCDSLNDILSDSFPALHRSKQLRCAVVESKMGTSTRCGCSWISGPIPMHLWKRGKQQSTIYNSRTYSAGITKCDPLRHHRMPTTKETIPIASFWFRTQCHVEKSNAECNKGFTPFCAIVPSSVLM